MSYNYDANPWDDNYGSNTGSQNAQQQQQPGGNYGGYSEGFNNPVAQYSDNIMTNQPQSQYQYDQQDTTTTPQQQQYDTPDQQQQQQQQESATKPTQSALGRFLRQHVPLCGAFMDTISGIDLPFIDALVQHVNRDLLVSKMFYFFFYSAFGSLFPLMGVYFKQLGMNPAQVGILTGVRPFIEIFSAPFWSSLAERFHKSKALLLFSVFSWIIFTYSLAHIRPPASACVAFNDTYYVLYIPYSDNDLSNYDVGGLEDNNNNNAEQLGGGGGSRRGENEMFMNKMPAAVGGKEGKDEILASEENQNDQRRRRRRKRRQVSEPDEAARISSNNKGRYLYTIEEDESGKVDNYESPKLELDVDLENDFDDKLIGQTQQESKRRNSLHHGPTISASSRFFEMENEDANPDYDDELEQMYSKGTLRYKRGTKGDERDIDDVLGESDGPDQEEAEENEEEPKGSGGKKVNGNKAANNNEEENKVGGEEEAEEEEAEEGSREPKKTAKQQASPEVTAATTASNAKIVTTETTATYEYGSQEQQPKGPVNKTKRVFKQRHKTPPTHIVGMSPITVEYAINYNKEKHSSFVTPMFSTIVYKLDDIKEVFFLLLLLISLGEFFSAPALTLADQATLGYLGDNTDLYGRQRMFGSLSWAITLLLVGMALDNATSIADHPCGPHQRERSYTVCFIIFSLLMACAFLTATQFRFNYPKSVANSSGGGSQALMATTTDNKTVVTTTVDGSHLTGSSGNIDELYASTQPRSIFNTAPPVNAPPPNLQQQQAGGGGGVVGGGKEKFEFLDKWKSAVFAQRTGELPEWVNVFRQFRNSLHLTYLFITWFLGCGVGLVFTFLFWHLQDVGGTPTLFGICSVINHISEILAYFFSFSFIKRFGHTRVLSVGLGCNVIRFLYVAFLTDPYYALPFELVQGITHAACFAACCSYISHVSKPELRTSTQGVMQGLHHGIGRACGALIGGYMINAIGSRASFCIYGLLSGCVLAGFLYVRRRASQLEDEREVKVDDSEALGGYGAPQGVPSAIPGKIGGGAGASLLATHSSGTGQQQVAQDIDYQW